MSFHKPMKQKSFKSDELAATFWVVRQTLSKTWMDDVKDFLFDLIPKILRLVCQYTYCTIFFVYINPGKLL